jgi:hypothetical protein
VIISPQIGLRNENLGKREVLCKSFLGNKVYAAGLCRATPLIYDLTVGPKALATPSTRAYPGLRVIDASVMPSVTSTNANAPILMIAEKGAAMSYTSFLRATRCR